LHPFPSAVPSSSAPSSVVSVLPVSEVSSPPFSYPQQRLASTRY
jgi:hypothetical protein